MAFFVLVGLIAVLVVYISLVKNKKRAVLISVVILGVFYLYVSRTCGPNSADVKVMKPMAEKISDYIVKNGIPESLKDIPGLPYGLVGCERKQTYYENYIKVSSQKHADSEVIESECYFVNKKEKYNLYMSGNYDFNNGGDLMIRIENRDKNSRTGIQYFFKIEKNRKIYIDYKGEGYSSKMIGICSPWKQ